MLRSLIYETFTSLAAREAAELEKASKNPRAAQMQRLNEIIFEGRGTRFAVDHGLESVRTYEDFCRAIPVGDYSTFSPYIERMMQGERRVLTRQRPRLFATTSGTTGYPKYIPVTDAYIAEFRRASKVSCLNLYRHFPGIASGNALAIVSPAQQGSTAAGIPCGSISGYLYQAEPELVRREISAIPYEVLAIPDYETRYYCILRIALVLPISSIYTLNPSTIDLLVRRLHLYAAQLAKDITVGSLHAPGNVPQSALKAMAPFLPPNLSRGKLVQKLAEQECSVAAIWPDLQVISCWTRSSASFYMSGLTEHFAATPICDITYGASEGRGSVFLAPDRQMLALRSHFFEFIPEDEIAAASPSVLLCDQLTVGHKYYVLFTTSAGLYRYNIGDIIEVTGFHNGAPLIEFVRRGGSVSSFSGEKITEQQVIEAVAAVGRNMSITPNFFVVIPVFDTLPRYEVWLETSSSVPSITLFEFARLFDEQLGLLNVEYRDKRESGRLAASHARLLSAGSYDRYRRNRVERGADDTQIKLSHLNPGKEAQTFFAELLLSR